MLTRCLDKDKTVVYRYRFFKVILKFNEKKCQSSNSIFILSKFISYPLFLIKSITYSLFLAQFIPEAGRRPLEKREKELFDRGRSHGRAGARPNKQNLAAREFFNFQPKIMHFNAFFYAKIEFGNQKVGDGCGISYPLFFPDVFLIFYHNFPLVWSLGV